MSGYFLTALFIKLSNEGGGAGGVIDLFISPSYASCVWITSHKLTVHERRS